MKNKMIIYQVLPRLFGNQNDACKCNGTIEENGVGKLADFTPKVLREIKMLFRESPLLRQRAAAPNDE